MKAIFEGGLSNVVKMMKTIRFDSTASAAEMPNDWMNERRVVSRKEDTASNDSLLKDQFGRLHSYLRISVTERCNLRCTYCMPAEGVKLSGNDKLLTAEEIRRLVGIFAGNGVDKVRLTGGEPTVRPDLLPIVESMAKTEGIKEVAMTSNGVALERKLDALVSAGLNRLNISLDTLSAHKFQLISRRNGFDKVWRCIDKAQSLFNPVKLNCVVIRNINDDEINDFVALTKTRNIDVRFIEYMPFGGNQFQLKRLVSYKEMLENIKCRWSDIERLSDKPNDTSKAYKISGWKGQFGFITSMSEHFCGTCNRLRITADGNLKVCLHGNSEVSLRDHLRSGHTDEQICAIIGAAVRRKLKQHAGVENLMKMTNRPMILIGQKSAICCSMFESRFNASCYFQTVSYFSTSSTIHSKNEKSVDKTVNSSGNCDNTSEGIDPLEPWSDSDIGGELKRAEKSELSHLSSDGKAKMVDVTGKSVTVRSAKAGCRVELSPHLVQLLQHNQLDKGDALQVARLAAIMAAKRTSDLIPLCHNICLTDIQVSLQLDTICSCVRIESVVKCLGKTGPEMEALTACAVAALTLYDMCKAVGSITVSHLGLIEKSGGKTSSH